MSRIREVRYDRGNSVMEEQDREALRMAAARERIGTFQTTKIRFEPEEALILAMMGYFYCGTDASRAIQIKCSFCKRKFKYGMVLKFTKHNCFYS